MWCLDHLIAPILVEVIRDARVESVHRGNLICLDSKGDLILQVGDVNAPIYPRSALKPAQAVAMLKAGAPLSGSLLAIAAGSHSGAPEHVALLTSALHDHGIDLAALQCPPDSPDGSIEKLAWATSGAERESVIMNCSGKHTGMLIACVVNGWPTDSYLDFDHPLQRLIFQTIEELCREKIAFTTVDGCGAPLHMVSLRGLANLAQTLVLAKEGTYEARVANAMREHPDFVAGKGRDTEIFMRSVPGFLTKEGAEGVQLGAMATGESFAFKIEDGSMRARPPVVGAILNFLGVDQSVLRSLETVIAPEVLGGGKSKGRMQAVSFSK